MRLQEELRKLVVGMHDRANRIEQSINHTLYKDRQKNAAQPWREMAERLESIAKAATNARQRSPSGDARMDRNEVIRLAEYVQASTEHPKVYVGKVFVFRDDQIERFAELVTANVLKKCVKACEDEAAETSRMAICALAADPPREEKP